MSTITKTRATGVYAEVAATDVATFLMEVLWLPEAEPTSWVVLYLDVVRKALKNLDFTS